VRPSLSDGAKDVIKPASGRLTYLTRRQSLMTVDLNTSEPPSRDGSVDHLHNPTGITSDMHEGKANEPSRTLRHDLCDLRISLGVVGVEECEHDRLVDSGGASASHIGAKIAGRRGPRRSQASRLCRYGSQ